MILLQNKFNYAKAFKIAFFSSIYMLLLTVPNVLAKESKIPEEKPIFSKNVCPTSNLLPKRSFDTEKYQVYICRGDRRHSLGYYVRIPKSGGKFTIPVTSKKGETYIAQIREVKYFINPYEMLTIKKDRLILQEEVRYAVSGDGKALKKGCPQGKNTFVKAETKSFITYICGGAIPSSYIAIARNGSTPIINLALQSYNSGKSDTSKYVANQGNISYTLTRKALRISQSGRSVIKEKILKWSNGG